MNRTSVTIAVVLSCIAAQAQAGGFSISSLGSRRTGMGTNIASPDDATALLHNVAGLADQKGRRLHISGGARLFGLSFRMKALDPQRFPEINPEGCVEANGCPWPVAADGSYARAIEPESYFGFAPYAAATTDLGFLGREDIVVGLAAYAPNFYGATLASDAPSAYQVVDSMFIVGALTAGVAWRASSKLAVGATLSFHHMRMSASRRLSVVDTLTPTGESPEVTALLAQSVTGDLIYDFNGRDHGVGWSTGAVYSPADWFSLGLQYSGATQPSLEGGIEFRYADAMNQSSSVSEIVQAAGYKLPQRLQLEMPYPHSLFAGVTFAPTDRLEIGVDLRTWLYNTYKTQKVVPEYDPEEPGDVPFTTEDLSSDKGYGLSYDIALGFLVRPLAGVGLDLMTGCGFDKSPIPNRTFSLDNPAMSSVYCSAGVRYQSEARWRVAATYIYVDYLARTITNSETEPPSNGSGDGDTHIPTVEMEYTF